MNEKEIKLLLRQVKEGSTGVEDAVKKLKNLPFEALGYATVDHHRALRRGQPETIFCEGKTLDQIKGIAAKMMKSNTNVLATRASHEVYEALKEVSVQVEYHEQARIVVINRRPISATRSIILVVTAGTADIPVAEEAVVTATVMGNTVERLYDVGIAGIHRLLAYREKLDQAGVLIVAAGMDGALPGVVAGLTGKPVIAVPTSVGYGVSFGGLSALLTMLNSCAGGVSVVNIDNGYGAAYCASLINRLAERRD
ncbi:MAG: nickel pincer cofactor biosynthesis protein LarB [Spirochaetes bacterium]|nr:nickel pincer cofactor biosynthesis protein LarB [Spirochaetota bacterium]